MESSTVNARVSMEEVEEKEEEEEIEDLYSAESNQFDNFNNSAYESKTELIEKSSVSSANFASVKSDATGAAPEADESPVKCVLKKGSTSLNAEDYVKARTNENEEFITSSLHAVESLAPFTLKRVYGRLDNVPVLNLTGIYKNHIVYASSNVIIIYDFVENVQKCLQGHRNPIRSLEMEKKGRFIVSSAAGKRNLIIVWETMSGKPLKYFPNTHDGHGCVSASFTGVDYIFASIGAEEMGKQTICFWNYEPKETAKTPILSRNFPKTKSVVNTLSFSPTRPEFFAATGDRNVIFGTWIRDRTGDSVSMHKPKLRKTFITKYKTFSTSLWMKKGEWLATATGAGFVVIWGPPVVLALEDPPDPTKNIREFQRSFKLCEERITVFKIYKEYVVIGDEIGIVRFFDHDFKLLRWTKNFNLPAIQSISFNRTEEVAEFKKNLRDKYNSGDGKFPTKDKNCPIKEYTRGGTNFRLASKTTVPKPPMPCPDFVLGVAGGDVYYYHFNEMQLDRVVPGTPAPFVSCDACPGSNHIAFTTLKGDIQVYDFSTHELIFSDRIFAGNAKITTMKFHPFGQICSFGLSDGRISFRWTYTWKTSMPPTTLTPNSVVRIIYSIDGLHLAYYDSNQNVAVMKYLPKGHGWMVLGKNKAHYLPIVDLQFFIDPDETCNRLFSIGLDRHLIEYDIDRSAEDFGLFIVKITSLEQTARPSAMVFNGPQDFGIDCITFANNINKIRLFSLEEEKVKKTCSGPIFGREKGITRMISFPTQMTEQRFKKFIVYIVKNKLGLMDTPIDGNPHKYMAVLTHPKEIIEVAVLADRERIFTIGKDDSSGFVWEASPKAVEATVLMGGSGVTPFYHTLKRHWGGACQDILKDLDMIFFFLNVKRIEKQTELYRMNRNIRLCEVPAVARACGFFPSEYEVELMMDEARRLKQAAQSYTDDLSTEVSFDEFLIIFVNHFYRTTDEDVEEAFAVLGFSEGEEPYMCKHDFVKYLTEEGEKVKPRNFPIFFNAMFDVRQPGEFGDVKCHTVMTESALEDPSDSLQLSEKDADDEQDVESFHDSSSSSGSGSDDDDLEEEDDEEEEEEEEEMEGHDDDDREDEKRKSSIPKVLEEEEFGQEIEDEETQTDGVLSPPPEEEEEIPEPVQVKEEVLELPERIDLIYFLNSMIPPESQQTMRWKTKEDIEKEEHVPPVDTNAILRVKQENAFLNSLIKEIVDPMHPIPKKLLNTLYAEYYLEHGDFSVPPDIRFASVKLPGINEIDDPERKSKTSVSSGTMTGSIETAAASKDELQEEAEEEEEETIEDEEGENEGEEEGESEENTGEEAGEGDDEAEESSKTPDYTESELLFGVPENSELFPDQSEIFADQSEIFAEPSELFGGGDEEENGEGPEETTAAENEEGTYSAPFTLTTTVTDSQNREYETDATEEMTDLDNMYDQEEMEFVRNINKSFRPTASEKEAQEQDPAAADKSNRKTKQ